MVLKTTTSIEEEFDFLFAYVVKDCAWRNFHREKRDAMIVKEDKGLNVQLHEMGYKWLLELNVSESFDSMSISGDSSTSE